MASPNAWNAGWNIGAQLAQERRAQKQGRANEIWEDRRDEFKTNVANLAAKYRTLLGPNGEDTPKSLEVKYALNQAQQAKDEFENPPKTPGAMARFEQLLHLTRRPQTQTVTSETGGFAMPAAEAGTLPAGTVPAAESAPAPAMPVEKAAAAPTPAGLSAEAQQLQQNAQAPEPAMPTNLAAGLGAGPGPKMPKQTEAVSGPALTPQQLKQKAQASQKAQQEAGQLLAGAPLSPGEQAIETSHATTAGASASVQDAMKMFDTLNPGALPQERQAFQAEVTRKALGMTEKPLLKLYTLPDGSKAWLDASRPDLIPPGATADVTENADTRKRADFAAFQKTHPEYKGTFEQWVTEQASAGRAAVPKPETPDQRFLSIEQKRALGQPLTPDDLAFQKAYKEWQYIKTTAPRIAGYQALAWSRIVQVEVPGRPGETTFVPAGVAYKSGMKGPSSVSHLVSVYYTTGKGGQDLLRFNTATHHLKLMTGLAEALNNGDIQAVNRFSNEWATATGSAAPTNFNDIRDAVAGELSRLYTGVGATEQEIANIESGVSNAQSPEQLAGTIQTDLAIMQGKIQASAEQYLMGTQGEPAFPEDIVPPAAPAPVASPATPGPLKQQGQQNLNGGPNATAPRHKIKIGDKYYVYKGSGDTADLYNYTQVQQ